MTFSLLTWCGLVLTLPRRLSPWTSQRTAAEEPPAALHEDLGLPPVTGQPPSAEALRDMMLR